MIYLTGDTHGEWMKRLNKESFPEQKNMTKNDYVIILGDFGIWDNSKQEKYNLDWLESRNFTTLFISGNHENYDILDNLPDEEWHGGKVNKVRPSVIHLKRGQIFNINGFTFFTFGGASSHDIQDGILDPNDKFFKSKEKKLKKENALYRVNHVTWWERELPSQQEMKDGIINIDKNNKKIDFVLTHSPFSSILLYMDAGCKLYNTDYLTDYLENIYNTTEFKCWFFGHMHVDEKFSEFNSICLYEQIVQLC